jgi:hypothetical protein
MSANPAPAPIRKRFFTRITASVPLLVTVIVHVVLVAVAGYFVVSEQILGKKKNFEGAPPSDNSVVQKQVEHRLQVARKGGGSANTTPVSANRIFSSDASALQLPAMPDLPSMGASSLGGMGFGAGAGGVGTGTGYGTGLGSGSGLGSGFMTMSFLGTTSQRASKIVFVVDVGPDLMDIKKGGFEAFSIVREEILKLISRLPPSAEFGVVIYESSGGGRSLQPVVQYISAFSLNLLPATSSNKTRFFEWMKPVNSSYNVHGIRSAAILTSWSPKPLPKAGLDDDFRPPAWVVALRCALEMGPDTIYVVAGSSGSPARLSDKAEFEKRKKVNEDLIAEHVRSGLNLDSISAARSAALDKAMDQLDEVNAKLRAKGQPPLIVQYARRIFDADFQASLKQKGFSIPVDYKGWTDKAGRPIWGLTADPFETADYSEVHTQISKLQSALLRERASLNIFLFVGPNQQPKADMDNLAKASSRNGGKFQLLTTKKLKEIVAQKEAAK